MASPERFVVSGELTECLPAVLAPPHPKLIQKYSISLDVMITETGAAKKTVAANPSQ
jgi:hypothetical protein